MPASALLQDQPAEMQQQQVSRVQLAGPTSPAAGLRGLCLVLLLAAASLPASQAEGLQQSAKSKQ